MNLLNAAKSLLLVSFLVWVASLGCVDSDAPGELPIILQLVKDEDDEGDEGDEGDEDDDEDDDDEDDEDDDEDDEDDDDEEDDE